MEALQDMALTKIKPSPRNIRKHFDPKKMTELEASIRDKGVRVPIMVRPAKGHYLLVYGERRWTASKNIKAKTIPAIIAKLTDDQALEYQVIENLQREDLTPMDEARGFQALLKKLKWTKDALASKIGKSVRYVATRVRLLTLPAKVQEALDNGTISPGHGEVMLRLHDPKQQKDLLDEIIGDKLSVRAAENMLDNYGTSFTHAQFDTTECSKCESNGKLQVELFDTDTDLEGSCMNRVCFMQKGHDHIKHQVKELKAKGFTVLDQKSWDSRKNKRQFDKWELKDMGRVYKSQCKAGCKSFVYILESDKYHDDRPPTLTEGCLDEKCMQKAKRAKKKGKDAPAPKGTAKQEEKARQELNETKIENFVGEARRKFWRATAIKNRTKLINKAIILSRLLTDVGTNNAAQFLPWYEGKKVPEWCNDWTVRRLYALGEKQIDKMTDRVVAYNIENLYDDQDLAFMTAELKFSIDKHWTITKEYLDAHTKPLLMDLAKEIGLIKYLEKKEPTCNVPGTLAGYSKTDMVETFLKSGFDLLKCKTPKAMLRKVT